MRGDYMRRRKKSGTGLLVLALGLVVILGVSYALVSIVPSVRKLAVNRAKEIAILKVNEAISDKFCKEEINYADIVDFTYSQDGKICAVNNNISVVNVIKSQLVQTVTKTISEIDSSEISLPVGTLSGMSFLYGVGPYLPIKIKPYGYAVADIVTDFSSSGINQTIFEVTVTVSAKVSVLMPMMKSGTEISTSVPVISTVIVGDVPDSYTNVERYGEEYEEDVLQLAE